MDCALGTHHQEHSWFFLSHSSSCSKNTSFDCRTYQYLICLNEHIKAPTAWKLGRPLVRNATYPNTSSMSNKCQATSGGSGCCISFRHIFPRLLNGAVLELGSAFINFWLGQASKCYNHYVIIPLFCCHGASQQVTSCSINTLYMHMQSFHQLQH